jgi:hypothetical protein
MVLASRDGWKSPEHLPGEATMPEITMRTLVNRQSSLAAEVRTLRSRQAPVVSVTATGTIQMVPGKLFVAPTQVGLARLQDLHLQASGQAPRFRGGRATLEPIQAFRSYSDAVVSALAQIAVIPDSGRAELLTQMLDFADMSGSLGGLEGPFLTAARSAQLARNDALFERAQDAWAGIDAGGPIGGGALSVPVLDVGSGQLAFLTEADLTGKLGMGAESLGMRSGVRTFGTSSTGEGTEGRGGGLGTEGRSGFGADLQALSSLSGMGGLGGTGSGLNGGSGAHGFGSAFGPDAFSDLGSPGGLTIRDLIGGDGSPGRGFGVGPDMSSEADGAAIGGVIGGAIGGIAGAIYGFVAGIPTGPGAVAIGTAGTIAGGSTGIAIGTVVGGGIGIVVGHFTDDAPAPSSPNPSGDSPAPSTPAPTGGSTPAPAPTDDGTAGGLSGGTPEPTGGDSSGGDWHPPMPLPDEVGDRSLEGDYRSGRSGSGFSVGALFPSGPGLESLTSYQGGTAFLIPSLPSVDDYGGLDFGFLSESAGQLFDAAGVSDATVPVGAGDFGLSRRGTVAAPTGRRAATATGTGTQIRTGTVSSGRSTVDLAMQLESVATQLRHLVEQTDGATTPG